MTTPNNSPYESVWDYPRPPRLEPCHSHIRILHRGVLLVETIRSLRVLETSHPPVFYIPPGDIAMNLLKPSLHRASFCEFKGLATYWTIDLTLDPTYRAPSLESALSTDAAWSYDQPKSPYEALRNHLAFYASRVDECTVDGELVTPQPGDFYGGWITSHVLGPFKGPPGTSTW